MNWYILMSRTQYVTLNVTSILHYNDISVYFEIESYVFLKRQVSIMMWGIDYVFLYLMSDFQ